MSDRHRQVTRRARDRLRWGPVIRYRQPCVVSEMENDIVFGTPPPPYTATSSTTTPHTIVPSVSTPFIPPTPHLLSESLQYSPVSPQDTPISPETRNFWDGMEQIGSSDLHFDEFPPLFEMSGRGPSDDSVQGFPELHLLTEEMDWSERPPSAGH
jgi:hypothetical protein